MGIIWFDQFHPCDEIVFNSPFEMHVLKIAEFDYILYLSHFCFKRMFFFPSTDTVIQPDLMVNV